MRTGDGSAIDGPIGVISAVIVDGAAPERLLVGVRRATAIAPRHPGVVSTPTVRVAGSIFELLTAAYDVPAEEPGMHAVKGDDILLGHGGHHLSADGFAIEALFARKLGLAGPLTDGRLRAVARPRYVSLDNVSDPLGTQACEWTAMLSYEVRIERGAETLPSSTDCYSRLVWVEQAKVPEALRRRDAMLLDESLNVFEVCIDGLCIRTAALMLAP